LRNFFFLPLIVADVVSDEPNSKSDSTGIALHAGLEKGNRKYEERMREALKTRVVGLTFLLVATQSYADFPS